MAEQVASRRSSSDRSVMRAERGRDKGEFEKYVGDRNKNIGVHCCIINRLCFPYLFWYAAVAVIFSSIVYFV